MAMVYQQLVPVIAVAQGVAMSLAAQTDPLISSGLLDINNVTTIASRSDGGWVTLRLDGTDWATGWGHRQQVSTTADFAVETQVTVPWIERHAVKTRSGDTGLLLNANLVDANMAGMSNEVQGAPYIANKVKQAVSSVYAGYKHATIQGIFADHEIRDNSTGNTSMQGQVVDFATDVPNPFHVMTTDLTAVETEIGQNGQKLYRELSAVAAKIGSDGSGRLIYLLVNKKTFLAMKMALNDYDRMSGTSSRGSEDRDNVKYTLYQEWFNFNDMRVVGMEDSFFPTVGVAPSDSWRCVMLTKDAIKVGVIKKAFNSSASANGMTISGGMAYAQQNSHDFAAIMDAIVAKNPSLPNLMAKESGRQSFSYFADRGTLGESSLLNCITTSLERLPGIPGVSSSGHYSLRAQMYCAVIRNNVNQLIEFRVPTAKVPATSIASNDPCNFNGSKSNKACQPIRTSEGN